VEAKQALETERLEPRVEILVRPFMNGLELLGRSFDELGMDPSLSARGRAMKMGGRAEASGDFADLICRLGGPRSSWLRLKTWVQAELGGFEMRSACGSHADLLR
jgi:hypothetical protein